MDQARDELSIPLGPLTRARAKMVRDKMNPSIQAFVSKGIEAAEKKDAFLEGSLPLKNSWISSSNVAIPMKMDVQEPLDVH